MRFRIEPAIFDRHPALLVGTLTGHGLRNGPSPAELTALLRAAEGEVRARFADGEALKAHPTVAAWQEIHRAFGSNPNKFPSSVHALAKRVVNGGALPSVHALVDLYNVVSLRHLLTAGGEDLARCEGDIRLTVAEGGEPFAALGEDADDPAQAGEVVYRDDASVICRRFNWREAARTALTEATTDAVLVVEAVPPTMRVELEAALADLEALAARFCGGAWSMWILDAALPEHGLDAIAAGH